MEDKLLKILKIKIDAINQNIDNLNYLNGELENKNNDLAYINSMIGLFKDNDILNFDQINSDDFNKILSMIDLKVAEIFKDKTCNYDGIIYIIQGIRQSISLQLTDNQMNAIYSFIQGMKNTAISLNETINNLEESKAKLPQTDLVILSNNLANYENIVSKFENGLYLTEIEEISEALDFSNAEVLEKLDIYEYILRYNADIYKTEDNDNHDDKDEVDLKKDFEDINFNYDTIDTTFEPIEPVKEEVNKEETDSEIKEPDSSLLTDIPSFSSNVLNQNDVDDNKELNTVELEDIIKKIDAKLKDMEVEETKPSNDTFITENNLSSMNKILDEYGIVDLNIDNNPEEVGLMLKTLSDHKILDILKFNKPLLNKVLSSNNNEYLLEVISIIRDNLLINTTDLSKVLEIFIKTMPILFIDKNVFDSFKMNLNFFKEKNINIINLFDNYRELLIVNNDVLKSNYQKVIGYGIEVNNDNVKYLLYNKNVLSNLDYYIEAIGYEKGFLGRENVFDGFEYVQKNPYKINNINREILMRLRYSSEKNGKIYGSKEGILSGEITNLKVDILKVDSDYIDSYFNNKYDFLTKEEYDKLKKDIDNLSEFDMTLDGNLNKLDSSYKISDIRYKFDNVYISRHKTVRLYNYLKNKTTLKQALLIALTYNSVLKEDEYKKIETVVNSIVEGDN